MQCQSYQGPPAAILVSCSSPSPVEVRNLHHVPRFLSGNASSKLLPAYSKDEKRMCKCKKLLRLIQVIEELLLRHNYRQVIYLGDGRGDYCPCTRLGPNDHILARQKYPDGRECSLLRLLTEQGLPIKDCRQRLSPSHKSVGDESSAAGSNGEASTQGKETFANTGESSDVSFAKNSQELQSDAADVDGARCQGMHTADEQLTDTEQQSTLCSLAVDEEAKDSSRWQHASVHSWSAAADAANLIQLLLNTPARI